MSSQRSTATKRLIAETKLSDPTNPSARVQAWRKKLLAERAGSSGLNGYKCTACMGIIITIDVDPGVTPMTLGCRATTGCKGQMVSWGYPSGPLPEGMPGPAGEWGIPTRSEYAELSHAGREHVNKGGLILRDRTDRPSCYQAGI